MSATSRASEPRCDAYYFLMALPLPGMRLHAVKFKFSISTTVAVALFSYVATQSPAGAAQHFTGEARNARGALLYLEQHWIYRDGDSDARLVLYTCPDGAAFARKHLQYGNDAQAPDFAFDDARTGFGEGVRGNGVERTVFIRDGKTRPERTARVTLAANSVVDAGFDDFVRTHWDALRDGESLPIGFVVPSKLGAVDFNVQRIGAEKFEGVDAVRYRLELTRWYARMLPHIDVIYDAASHQLLNYVGIGNIRSNDAHNLDVRITFLPDVRTSATDADVRAASSAPLSGSCVL